MLDQEPRGNPSYKFNQAFAKKLDLTNYLKCEISGTTGTSIIQIQPSEEYQTAFAKKFQLYLWQTLLLTRGPVLWNILISKDKNFSNTSYKNLKRKVRSMDVFKALTFKGTSTTTIRFRREDFNYI